MKSLIVVLLVAVIVSSTGCSRKKSTSSQTNISQETVGSVEANRAEARTLLAKGKELYRGDEDQSALEAFQQAVKLDPDLAEGHFRLGLTYDALGQEKEAEESYKQAVASYKKYLNTEFGEGDSEAHYDLGQTYNGLHLYTEAVREYRQAIRIKPDDAAIHYDLGLALMKLAQYDEAVSAFNKSLEIDPQNYRAEDSLVEAKEGVTRIRTGRKHQEDLLKKKKEEKKEEGGDTPDPKNANVRKA